MRAPEIIYEEIVASMRYEIGGTLSVTKLDQNLVLRAISERDGKTIEEYGNKVGQSALEKAQRLKAKWADTIHSGDPEAIEISNIIKHIERVPSLFRELKQSTIQYYDITESAALEYLVSLLNELDPGDDVETVSVQKIIGDKYPEISEETTREFFRTIGKDYDAYKYVTLKDVLRKVDTFSLEIDKLVDSFRDTEKYSSKK